MEPYDAIDLAQQRYVSKRMTTALFFQPLIIIIINNKGRNKGAARPITMSTPSGSKKTQGSIMRLVHSSCSAPQ